MLCCAVLLDGPEVGWMEGRWDGRVRNRTVVGDTRHPRAILRGEGEDEEGC